MSEDPEPANGSLEVSVIATAARQPPIGLRPPHRDELEEVARLWAAAGLVDNLEAATAEATRAFLPGADRTSRATATKEQQ